MNLHLTPFFFRSSVIYMYAILAVALLVVSTLCVMRQRGYIRCFPKGSNGNTFYVNGFLQIRRLILYRISVVFFACPKSTNMGKCIAFFFCVSNCLRFEFFFNNKQYQKHSAMSSDCEKSKNYIMIENLTGYRVYLSSFCNLLLIFSKILLFYISKIFFGFIYGIKQGADQRIKYIICILF